MNTNAIYYIGIDLHKHFSQVHVLDQNGETVWKGRIEDNDPELFAGLVRHLGGKCRAVLEATMNWHVLHDALCGMEGVEEVVLANPFRLRVICEAQVKNDKVDARKLAELLRIGMVPRAHAASREARKVRELVRQRACWTRIGTRLRNRTHRLLGALGEAPQLPKCSDLFGTRGMKAMRQLELPEPHKLHMEQNLEMIAECARHAKVIEKLLEARMKDDPAVRLLGSIPGIGKVLGCVIACEVDDIGRFATKSRFVAYCGLAPTTHASGGKVHNGRMMFHCNRWLKWAFVEAAWVAVGCDGYFGSLHRAHTARGKKPNTAIVIVARRMARIAWEVLRQKRPYQKRTPQQAIPQKPVGKAFPARS